MKNIGKFMARLNMKLISNSDLSSTTQTKAKRALTDKEASVYIGMGESWLRHGRVTGARFDRIPCPPFIKIGRSVRYLIEDLDFWLEQFKKFDHLAQLVNESPLKKNKC